MGAVAPTQGRGLKPAGRHLRQGRPGRPYTGARIETTPGSTARRPWSGRPYTGARIETISLHRSSSPSGVAPTQGRGLKHLVGRGLAVVDGSPLHRGAD